MATLIALFTLGKDAELRATPSGDQVATLALAYNWGRKGQDGKTPTQWVEASLWGKQAESLAQYLLKGKQIEAVIDDPHIETYDGRNGPGHKLVGKILTLKFARDGQRQEAAAAPAPAPEPRQQRQAPAPAPRPSSGFDDMDDDIPF
jgi:single-strand DNA-binding protein